MHSATVRFVTELTREPDVRSKAARLRTLVFVVTSLGAFMGSLDLSIVNIAFPALERNFSGDTTAALAWVITAYSITYGSLLVIAGRTADRIGSRRVFNLGLGVFCLGSALCAMAPAVSFLIAARTSHPDRLALGRHRRARRCHRAHVGCDPRDHRWVAMGLPREPPRGGVRLSHGTSGPG